MSFESPKQSIVRAEAVTANDAADVGLVADSTYEATTGLYVGTSGDVKVTLLGGDDVVFSSLAAGVIHPIRATRVHNTSTTAGSIVAVY